MATISSLLEHITKTPRDFYLHTVTEQGKCELIGYLRYSLVGGADKYTLLDKDKEEVASFRLYGGYASRWKEKWIDTLNCPCGKEHYSLKLRLVVLSDTSSLLIGTYKMKVGKWYYTREVHLNHHPDTTLKKD